LEQKIPDECPLGYAADPQSLSGPEPADVTVHERNLDEIDERADPPTPAPAHGLELCSFESLSKLSVRALEKPSGKMLREGVRKVLTEMDIPEMSLNPKSVVDDQKFLDEVGDHIRDANQFVAESFQNNSAAWDELLKDSRRQSSKKVLKWIQEGVQPISEGTQNSDPKKMRRVRSLLRRAVPKGQVESYLEGKMPHEVELQNH
jgi:hypothetical protein